MEDRKGQTRDLLIIEWNCISFDDFIITETYGNTSVQCSAIRRTRKSFLVAEKCILSPHV